MSSKKKRSPCPFASGKKPSKRKKVSKSFDKDRADVLAASDRGSYFVQDKLISLDEEEQSRWENETLALAGRKLKTKAKTILQNRTHKSNCKSWPVEQLLPGITCKKISRNQLPRFSYLSNHELFGAFAVRSCNFLICTRTSLRARSFPVPCL